MGFRFTRPVARAGGAFELAGTMTWWDVLALIGMAGGAVGIAGAELALLRLLPWGKDWHVGGYF